MNPLSTMLYWADVGPSLASFFGAIGGLLAVISLGAAVLTTAMWLHYRGEEQYARRDGEETSRSREYATFASSCRKVYVILWPVFAFLVLLTAATNFVPSKETIYAIAASEVAEDVVTSPEGVRARSILNKAMSRLEQALDKPSEDSSSSSSAE